MVHTCVLNDALVVTDTSQPRSYNNGVSTALDWDKLIPDVALSAVEVLTYFPKHLRWPSILIRLYKAGFRGPDMAKVCSHLLPSPFLAHLPCHADTD